MIFQWKDLDFVVKEPRFWGGFWIGHKFKDTYAAGNPKSSQKSLDFETFVPRFCEVGGARPKGRGASALRRRGAKTPRDLMRLLCFCCVFGYALVTCLLCFRLCWCFDAFADADTWCWCGCWCWCWRWWFGADADDFSAVSLLSSCRLAAVVVILVLSSSL